MAQSQLVKHLVERSPVTSEGFAHGLPQLSADGQCFVIKRLVMAFTSGRNLCLRVQMKGLTESLESDIVGGYLELEISLRVVGTAILGQNKTWSAGDSPWTMLSSIAHGPQCSAAEQL